MAPSVNGSKRTLFTQMSIPAASRSLPPPSGTSARRARARRSGRAALTRAAHTPRRWSLPRAIRARPAAPPPCLRPAPRAPRVSGPRATLAPCGAGRRLPGPASRRASSGARPRTSSAPRPPPRPPAPSGSMALAAPPAARPPARPRPASLRTGRGGGGLGRGGASPAAARAPGSGRRTGPRVVGAAGSTRTPALCRRRSRPPGRSAPPRLLAPACAGPRPCSTTATRSLRPRAEVSPTRRGRELLDCQGGRALQWVARHAHRGLRGSHPVPGCPRCSMCAP